ncbi:MAG: sigma factor-like helix-turn-helix DNA-binding protein [Sarcina sp.]
METINLNFKFDKELDVDIDKVFTANKLNLFLQYCDEHNIKMLSDISNQTFEEIAMLKGFGVGKINLIKETFENYIKEETKRRESIKSLVIEINSRWYNILKNYNIDIVSKILGLDNNLDLKIKDIQGHYISEFKEHSSLILNLVKLINSIPSVESIFDEILISGDKKKSISKRDLEYITYRVKDGLTLEKIGGIVGVTRERVRQVLSKAFFKINTALESRRLNTVLKLIFIGKSFCYIDDVYKLAGKQNAVLVKTLFTSKEIDVIKFYEPLGIVYFENEKDINKINRYIKRLPTTFKLYDRIDGILDILQRFGIDNIDIEKIEHLLVENGYRNLGEYYTKENTNFITIFEIVFRDYIKEPLYIDEVGYEIVRNACKEYLDFEFESSPRAIDGRLRDTENIILVEAKTYQHIKNMKFSMKGVRLIKEKLEAELHNNSIISAQAIFDKYSTEFIRQGIKNKYILYSLTSKYLDEFKIGRGNTLDISLSIDTLNLTREQQLIELIKENQGIISIPEVLRVTSWQTFKFEDTLSKSSEIIKIGDNITISECLKINDKLREKMLNLINKSIEKDDFISTTKIYNDLRSDSEFLDFIRKYDIVKSEKIAPIFKFIMPTLKGNTLFLYTKKSKYRRFDDVIVDKFRDVCDVSKIIEFMDFYGIDGMTRSKFINAMVSSGNFVKISQSKFMPIDKFNIDKNIVLELKNYINRKFEYKKYVILKDLDDYQNILPKMNYEWNPYLMETILLKNGYRRIERTFYDPGTEKLIIVKENSKIDKFDTLIYDIISTEYDGLMQEAKIFKFLASIGIIYRNNKRSDKKLPFDLYKSDKFDIDEYGKVELN